jgi:release factor glutamine methyltransferase
LKRWTVGELLKVSAQYLTEKGSRSALLDAELLLGETLHQERIELYTEHDRPLTPQEVDHYRALVARRGKGEPVAYILGRAHFRYLTLEVSPAVLIPRPETEELVGAALRLLKCRPILAASGGLWGEPLVADVGTGSGAIALAVAQESGVRVLAIDSSREALLIALRNRANLGLADLVELREGDLLAGVRPGSLHLVVSNPPYVTEAEHASLEADVRDHEPREALVGGDDGLDVYRRLLPEAARSLAPGGSLLLEVGESQAEAVSELSRLAGFARTWVERDLSGKERIVAAVRPGASRVSAAELSSQAVESLRAALRAGAVVGVPTDTVYGLAAAWDSAPGVRRLADAKERREEKPLQVLFSSVEAVRAALPDLAEEARRVMAGLLPGPFTFVVETAGERPPLVGTPDSLGVRVPDHPALLELLQALEIPLVASSANPTGGTDPRDLDEVDEALLAHAAAAFEDRIRPGHSSAPSPGELAQPSTVIDLRPLSEGQAPLVLREGAVGAADALNRIAAILAAD